MEAPARPQKLLPAIQGLRALAALSVAFVHFGHDAITGGRDPSGWLGAADRFLPWGAGVDIFFVISGFVIVHASAPLFGARSGPGIFLHRRLARIVPLYWIMTALFVGVLLVSRAAIHGDIGGPAYIAASFGFIPWPRPNGVMQPAFGLGWTLNYEMFFYLAFTPFLLLRRAAAVPAAIIVLSAFVLLGQLHHFATPQLGFWSNPIILEFCAGMLLAQAYAAGFKLPFGIRVVLPVIAVAMLHFYPAGSVAFRPLALGIPAFMLVGAAALAPAPATLSRSARLVVRFGDASYAMYLVHPFIMRAFSITWHRFHAHTELSGIIYVVAGIAAAQLCALAINRFLERKLNALLRGKSGRKNEIVRVPGIQPGQI